MSAFAVLVAISVLAAAAPAGAQRLSRRYACPEIIPCCPVPPGGAQADQTACCPGTGTCCTGTGTCCTGTGTCCTATSCPTGELTIGSSPNPSTAAKKVVISGLLTATPGSGVQVVLWREAGGQSSFQQLAQSATDSSGHYTFTVTGQTVMVDQEWYVTSGNLRSATMEQQVRALVGLAPSTRTVSKGQKILLHGSVSPSHTGEIVLIEQRHGAGWRVIGRPRLNKSSTFSLSHRFAKAGKSEFRAVLLGDTRNTTSTSPVLTLTVKP